MMKKVFFSSSLRSVNFCPENFPESEFFQSELTRIIIRSEQREGEREEERERERILQKKSPENEFFMKTLEGRQTGLPV